MEAGINLYSLRQLIHTEGEFAALVAKLKKMGYAYLQVSGLPLQPEEIARGAADGGLPVYLSHSPLNRILEAPDAVMAENAIFGCKNIGLGYLPPECIVDEKQCKDTIDRLNTVAETMRKAGFRFFLHHHHNEFYQYGKQSMMDYLLETAPEIHVIADTYWLQYGGANPVDYFEKLKGRVECVHLKDYKLRKQANTAWCEPHFAPVGAGTLDFRRIVAAAKQAGAQYFFVEQDDAGEYTDPYSEVQQSIDYIKENL